MNRSRLAIPIFVFLLLLFSTPSGQAAAPLPFDHSDWDKFLKQFVNEKGEVNYRAAQKDPRNLYAYLRKLRKIPNLEFMSWPREESIAVWLNAYHAGLIKMILKHYPVRRVTDIPGIWELPAVAIGKRPYSLNQIQDDALLQGFRDEKHLFALSSGAKSSPRLLREAYVGPRLEGQLYLAARSFVNDSQRNRIEPVEKKVLLSRIFRWYGRSFLLNWGQAADENPWNPQESAVLSFMVHYLDDAKKVDYLREGDFKVKYQDFDWRLNDWQA